MDRSRNLRLKGLAEEIVKNEENFESSVKKLISDTFGIGETAIEAIQKINDAESFSYALLTFRSRVNRNKCFGQKEKLKEPLTLEPDTQDTDKKEEDEGVAGEGEEKEEKELEEKEEKESEEKEEKGEKETLMEDSQEKVAEESKDTDGNVEKPVEEKPVLEAEKEEEAKEEKHEEMNGEKEEETEEKEVPKEEGDAQAQDSIKKAEGDTESGDKSGTETEVVMNGKEEDEIEMLENAGDKEEAATGEEGGTPRKQKGPTKNRVEWKGAPEFQWKTISSPNDRGKLIIDNVGVGDFFNHWLYVVISRARNVAYECSRDPKLGPSDNAMMKKGRLTLTFLDENQAMAAALNGLVFVRTRENKRLKVYLPQTPTALKMSDLLEKRLGQVRDPNEMARQLLIRDIDPEATVESVSEQVKKVNLAAQHSVQDVTIRDDALERKCAVVKFNDPESAIGVHMMADEIQLAKDSKWAKVYHMQDMISSTLLTKLEGKKGTRRKSGREENQQKRKLADESKTGGETEAKKGKQEEQTPKKPPTAATAGQKPQAPAKGGEKPQAFSSKRGGLQGRGARRTFPNKNGMANKSKPGFGGRTLPIGGPTGGGVGRRGGRGQRPQMGSESRFPPRGMGNERGPMGKRSLISEMAERLTQRGRGPNAVDPWQKAAVSSPMGGASYGAGGGGGMYASRGGGSNQMGMYGSGPGPYSGRGGAMGEGMDYDDLMMIKQQQKQLEYQQQLLKQQEIIRRLESEMSPRDRPSMGPPSAGGYGRTMYGQAPSAYGPYTTGYGSRR